MSLSFPSIWVPGSSFILASCLIGKEAISSILLDQWQDLIVQTSKFSCAEPNCNDLSSLFELICIRFGTLKVGRRNEALGLGQTSLFSCAEPNANELKQRLFFIYIRFGA